MSAKGAGVDKPFERVSVRYQSDENSAEPSRILSPFRE
jgi:hypothetical protein